MSRPLRVEYSGAYYHVINRGNNQENIFLNDRDREKFIEYLEKANERYSIVIHTYCLMSNHFHLLVETAEPNLSVAMQWINVSYATYFNRKRGRHGHLFQGRFKAILVDADEYLKHLSRYIHLNPLRAKMVSSAAKYKWSSYGYFIGKKKPPEFIETDWILSGFGKNKKEAQKNYKDFVERVDIKTLESPGRQVSEGFILGDSDFVKWVKDNFLSKRKDNKEIPQLNKLKPKVNPETLVDAVCKEFGCSEDRIIIKGKKNNKARQVAIHIAKDMSGMSCTDLGNYFGGVSGALITMMYNRVAKEASKNRRLKGRINKVKQRIFNI
jgi:REP element-mobilizing transposase RayT